MISAIPNTGQPITAEVDANGRLIRADDPIFRLHILAGGEEGGVLAVPALAKIAAITHSIKMRFARAVRVADEAEDVELWVETQYANDLVYIKIISWRKIENITKTQSVIGDEKSVIGANSAQLLFDRQLRLLSVSGVIQVSDETLMIGCAASKIFDPQFPNNANMLKSLELHRAGEFASLTLVNDNIELDYSAVVIPQKDKSGEFSGYVIDLKPAQEDKDLKTFDTDQTENLFGHQLGSVLRQPLGRIIANAETIGSKLHGPIRENYAVYAKDIADAARHLVALVDDLGDLEALDKPDFKTASDKLELGDIAQRVAGLLALKAADHRINIVTPDADSTVHAIAEFRRVLQILINLVTNALRYSPDGTTINMAIGQSNGLAEISVSDEGEGIATADHEKIFEKFERLGRSGDGGSGLGLYISRRLARAMGGDLIVSNAKTGGAKFTLYLPAQQT
jgi:nitrogen-specific signal transduction histidine kinase